MFRLFVLRDAMITNSNLLKLSESKVVTTRLLCELFAENMFQASVILLNLCLVSCNRS